MQNKIRDSDVRKTGHLFPWFDKPPEDGGVPLLQRHEKDIRFQMAAVDEHKALIVEHGIMLGSRSEAVAAPSTLANMSGREVTENRFGGGATLAEACPPHLLRPDQDRRFVRWAASARYLLEASAEHRRANVETG